MNVSLYCVELTRQEYCILDRDIAYFDERRDFLRGDGRFGAILVKEYGYYEKTNPVISHVFDVETIIPTRVSSTLNRSYLKLDICKTQNKAHVPRIQSSIYCFSSVIIHLGISNGSRRS